MLSILHQASVTAQEIGEPPERPSESPNRITLLIANRREKLMRLAALEGGAPPKTSPTAKTVNGAESGKPVGSKRKSEKCQKRQNSSKKTKLRRKRTAKESSDSDSDSKPTIDCAQPSTSTGVTSRMPRYATPPFKGSHMSSDDSSDDNQVLINSKNLKNSDTSDSEREDETHDCDSKKSQNKTKFQENGLKQKHTKNGNLDNKNLVQNGELLMSTPKSDIEKSRKIHVSDSGITSGNSTNEKCSSAGRNPNDRVRACSSDREQTLKNLERFRKKVDCARRGYRKRVMVPSSKSSSESSD